MIIITKYYDWLVLPGSTEYRGDIFSIQYSPFPPEVFLYAGPHAGHEVVEVHDDMDPHVEKAYEGCVTSPDPLDS